MFYPIRDFKILAIALAVFAAGFYALSLGGCERAEVRIKETGEPDFARGREELRRGNNTEAMGAFMSVVDKRKDAPESHFELGRLYLDHMNDPIEAIYHFRKYLELKPASPVSPMVNQMIETAQKKFAASLPETPFDSNIKRLELQEIVDSLRRQNLELKQKLASAVETIDVLKATQNVRIQTADSRRLANRRFAQTERTAGAQKTQADAPTQNAAFSTQSPAPARAATTYVVQAGDTLSTISRKFYGTKNRWKDIFSANRDRLATPESLKIGQSLKIP